MNPDETEPQNLIDLLNQLIEPPVPEPVSMAPQTAGWWVLGALVIAAFAYALWRLWAGWRANAYRREALASLLEAGDDPAAIATVLRRTALAAYPRRDVAGLSGADWIAFLQSTGDFPVAAGPALTHAPYAKAVDAASLHDAADHWIRKHGRFP
ncbi:DUF4381 domain-containing protein [Pseudoruegeria sp. HB172150]|uniref:DUF4381 domain-containing protein n=1 Tax=Pseudoruegeria sp. HB172150 TaxID=2721164 RepID=UPI00155595EF|nr:DUF4381 domain-containing protein [Pseudoruegeria sp. HB172150]